MFRVRRMDAALDMTFGQSAANFYRDEPAGPAQAILTRLCLWQGEWWLDLSEGTPWLQEVLGKPRGPGVPDQSIRARILGTPYVTRLDDYAAFWDTTQRQLTITGVATTSFGRTPVAVALPLPVTGPPLPAAASRRLPSSQARPPRLALPKPQR